MRIGEVLVFGSVDLVYNEIMNWLLCRRWEEFYSFLYLYFLKWNKIVDMIFIEFL